MSGVRGFVGVTDNSWYRLLADRSDLRGEVNFWRPGGGGFQALRPGEPFFFKTHAPHNRVVGGGFFGGAARLPASEAWDLLGPANGAASLGQMLDRIAHYRREPWAPGEDPVIGGYFADCRGGVATLGDGCQVCCVERGDTRAASMPKPHPSRSAGPVTTTS